MSLKAKDVKISFNLDDFTWGDHEDLRSRDLVKILDVCERMGEIEGKDKSEVREVLRKLHIDEVYKIVDLLTQAIRGETNPVANDGEGTEKN